MKKIPSPFKNNQSHKTSNTPWIYGIHTVEAALLNPNRCCKHLLLINKEVLDQSIIKQAKQIHKNLSIEVADKDRFMTLFGPSAVHQGIALQIQPLPEMAIEDIDVSANDMHVLILDQVTDPHNLGAILRSAAAFDTSAIIVTDQNSAIETNSALAKAASGALEIIPVVRVINLSRAMDILKDKGFWCVGLDEMGEETIDEIQLQGKIAIVLGSEGKGLRRLTKEKCDFLVKLPTSGIFSTLNVSNAAAVALYEVLRQNKNKMK